MSNEKATADPSASLLYAQDDNAERNGSLGSATSELFEVDYGVAVGVGGVFDDAAALHDEGYVLHDGDVGEGIALDGDDVGEAAGFKGADVFVFFEHGGGVDGGGLQCAEGRHAAADESAEFF